MPHPIRKIADRISSGRPSSIAASKKPGSWSVRKRASADAIWPRRNVDRAGGRVQASCDVAPADRDDARDDTNVRSRRLKESVRERALYASVRFPRSDREG